VEDLDAGDDQEHAELAAHHPAREEAGRSRHADEHHSPRRPVRV
jgi:hypothetical protein